MRPTLVLLAALVALAPHPTVARADAKVLGELDALTDDARAKANEHLELVAKVGEDAASQGVCTKARRALLVMGPLVWPVIENRWRLGVPEAARPHLAFLKALLSPKTEPELDELRRKVRVKMLTGSPESVAREVLEFRMGKPDPKKPGRRIPPALQPVKAGLGVAWRSSDGSFVVAFGPDGTEAAPDAPDFVVDEPQAGFVVAIGGKALPFARTSGHGANVAVSAPMGYAIAWSTDGAPGLAPGGNGGEGGQATGQGAAGTHLRQGAGGAGAPGESGKPAK